MGMVGALILVFIMLTAWSWIRPLTHSREEASRSTNRNDHHASCRTIEHDFGTTQLCDAPKRIVALDTYSLDLLLALDAEPIGFAEDRRALVGTPKPGDSINQVKYLGKELRKRPTHIGVSQSPSLEIIARLEPDLIVGRLWNEAHYPAYSKIAPTLLPLAEQKPDHWRTRLPILGLALEKESRAEAVLADHERQLARTRSKLASHQGASVLLLSMGGLNQMEIMSNDSFAGHLLEAVGLSLLVPSTSVVGSSRVNTSMEILPQLRPDLVIVMASGESQMQEIQTLWETHPLLRNHSAMQANQVHVVDYQLWSRINGPLAAQLLLGRIETMLLACEHCCWQQHKPSIMEMDG
jgi:iron complex transport system substrate-binding protein